MCTKETFMINCELHGDLKKISLGKCIGTITRKLRFSDFRRTWWN